MRRKKEEKDKELNKEVEAENDKETEKNKEEEEDKDEEKGKKQGSTNPLICLSMTSEKSRFMSKKSDFFINILSCSLF
jgi:hypothetical protein